jgi:hypothetical protein
MFVNTLSFVVRLWIIIAFWLFVWKVVEPKTQLMRVLRAALLVIGFLGILGLLRITGQ